MEEAIPRDVFHEIFISLLDPNQGKGVLRNFLVVRLVSKCLRELADRIFFHPEVYHKKIGQAILGELVFDSFLPRRNEAAILFFLQNGFDPSIPYKNKYLYQSIVCKEECFNRLFRELIRNEKLQGSISKFCVFDCIRFGDAEFIKQIVRDNDVYLHLHQDGMTPLLFASQLKSKGNIIKLLIESGVDVNSTNGNGVCALHLSAKCNHMENTEVLIKCGADINIKDDAGDAPLHYACRSTEMESVNFLLKNGADVHSRNNKGKELIHSSFLSKETLKLILEGGANINAKDNRGWTPLHYSIESASSRMMKILIENGANVNEKDEKGNTPLHLSSTAYYGSELVELLLKNGADLNLKNNVGQVPLHVATRNCNVGPLELLLSHGSDVNAGDTSGKTPLHLASLLNFKLMEDILKKNGANVRAKDNNGNTPALSSRNFKKK